MFLDDIHVYDVGIYLFIFSPIFDSFVEENNRRDDMSWSQEMMIKMRTYLF